MSKIVIGIAAAACLVCLPAPAQAGGSKDSCANDGFSLWDVSAEPYHVDNLVDERGNNDGWACAKPLKVVTDEEANPFQLYNFLDNKYH